MNPEEFALMADKIAKDCQGDPEMSHSNLDDLMAKVLRELGYGKGVDIIESTIRWCA